MYLSPGLTPVAYSAAIITVTIALCLCFTASGNSLEVPEVYWYIAISEEFVLATNSLSKLHSSLSNVSSPISVSKFISEIREDFSGASISKFG